MYGLSVGKIHGLNWPRQNTYAIIKGANVGLYQFYWRSYNNTALLHVRIAMAHRVDQLKVVFASKDVCEQ